MCVYFLQVMVTNAADESDSGCSDAFTLIASSEAPAAGDVGYSLDVTSPATGDIATAGEEYTIEVREERATGGYTWALLALGSPRPGIRHRERESLSFVFRFSHTPLFSALVRSSLH